MRFRLSVAVTLGFCVLGLAACGGGGGGTSPSSALAVSGSVVAPTPAAASAATTSPATGVAAQTAGAISVSAVDYFTNAGVSASITVDSTVTSAGNGTATVVPGSGLHSLQVAAAGYATYNGAIQVTGGTTARTIRLFPVSSLITQWLARVNADRAADGRNPVALDDMLTIAAYDHAVDMGTRGYFAHFDVRGYAPTTRSLLLGSMMMAAENIAAGYVNWTTTENAFMNEKQSLPNKSPADCANDTSGTAAHYCNIVYASHDWVGLAVASVAGSPYGTYYDQEFGDLYGRYDTSVVMNPPAGGSSLNLSLATANGAQLESYGTVTMPAASAISVATLNADPTCASQCPSNDFWYPTSPAPAAGSGSVQLPLMSNELSFAAQYGTETTFVGADAWALAAPSASAVPDTYANAGNNITTQSTESGAAAQSTGRIAPNLAPSRF